MHKKFSCVVTSSKNHFDPNFSEAVHDVSSFDTVSRVILNNPHETLQCEIASGQC